MSRYLTNPFAVLASQLQLYVGGGGAGGEGARGGGGAAAGSGGAAEGGGGGAEGGGGGAEGDGVMTLTLSGA